MKIRVYFRKWQKGCGSDAFKSYSSNLSIEQLSKVCQIIFPNFAYAQLTLEDDGLCDLSWLRAGHDLLIHFNIYRVSDNFILQKIQEFKELDRRFNQLQLFI